MKVLWVMRMTGWNVKSKHIATQLSVQNTKLKDNMGENVMLQQNLWLQTKALMCFSVCFFFFFPASILCTIQMNLYKTGNWSTCHLQLPFNGVLYYPSFQTVIWYGLKYQQADSHQVEIIKLKQQLSTVCCQETKKMLDAGGPAEICFMSWVI